MMMRKSILAAALISLFTVIPMRGIEIDTTRTVELNNHTYILKEDNGKVTVSGYDSEGNLLKPLYESHYKSGKKETVWQVEEAFSFPFSDMIRGKQKMKSRNRFNPHWAGIGFGFCNAIDHGHILKEPNGISLNFGRSFEIFWNIFNVSHAFTPHFGLVSGFGLDWRNYVMDGNRYFVRPEGRLEVAPIPEGSSLKYSRVKTFDLTFPLLLEWQTSKPRFFISAGPILNIKTYSSLKNRYYTADGHRQTFFKKQLGNNPVNLDLCVQVGFCGIAFYAKYGLFPMFQEEYAPAMQSFSTGLMWAF